MPGSKRILLIDGHALAFRAYHALPPLTSPSGEPTNATLGFANILLKAVDDLAPDYVLATFDSGRTFRHEEYADYKGTRAETPADLIAQFERTIELTRTLGVPVYTLDGYEADDLLGTLATQAAAMGLEAVIVTGDSDTLQLVGPGIKVFMPRRSLSDVQLYDEAAVIERYGLKPEQLIDYKAIAGDSSDNIPGVRGVGVKTATSLLQEYGDLAGIYAHLDDISSTRFRKALEEGRASADLSQHLVTIIRDLPVDIDLKAATWGQFDQEAALTLLRTLGFHALAQRLVPPSASPAQQMDLFASPPESDEPAPPVSDSYYVVDTVAKLADMVATLSEAGMLALDTETTGTDALQAKLVGISLAVEAGTAYYIPLGHQPQGKAAPQLPVATVAKALQPMLSDSGIVKVLHNCKFDMMMLRRYDMPIQGPIQDTMIAAWLLSPSGRGIGLKEQAFVRLGVNMTPIQELIGTGRSQVTMDRVSIARAAPYACADSDMTLRLQSVLHDELVERNQWQLFTELEMPLIPVLADMEEHGMAIDVPYLQEMAASMSARLLELVEQIYALAGHPFNINSTQQLASVLFDELGLPPGRRTKTGYSTDVGVLEKLAPDYPIVHLILEHRQLEKLKGTYVDALPALVNPDTGRIHSSFNQAGSSTGRLSSSDPNLQNIPVRSELGRMVRAAFVAPPGCALLACDYSQVELRVLAHVSGDEELTAAFMRDEDVHASTAAAVFDVPLEQVSKEQRSLAKAINFGLMYGMSDYGLASRTELDVPQAAQFIATYFARFAGVKRYLDETIARAHEQGYVETIFGRRRYFPELLAASSANRSIKQAAERAAINMPIQGSAADIIKVAMIRLDQRLREQKLASRQVLQVHDELVLEVPEDELAVVQALTVETMGHAVELNVPLKVDTAVGKNWMEME